MRLQKILSSKVIAVDTETTGLNWRKDRIHCVSISNGKYSECVHFTAEHADWIIALLKNKDILKVFANVNFDIHMFQRMGIEEFNNVMDVQLMAKILNENLGNYKLKYLAAMYIDKNAMEQKDKVEEYILAHGGVRNGTKIDNWDSSKVPDDILFPYAKKDAFYTYKLYELFWPAIEKDFLKTYEMEKALIPVIIAMERRGVPINTAYLSRQGKAFNAIIAPLRRKLVRLLGNINFNSPTQLARVFALKGVTLPVTEKGNPSTNKEALEGIDHPAGELLLEYKKATYLRNLYCVGVRNIAEDNVLYPSIRQMGARTGRLSCANPNCENIEMKYGLITKGFTCRKGYWMFYFDYSQIEMRIIADYSQDVNLLKAIALGQDLHTSTASIFYGVPFEKVTEEQRKVGKTINFAVSYGMGARGLARKFKVSEDEAREVLNKYYSLYPAIKFLNDRCKAKIYERGWIMTVSGRRRRLPKDLAYVALNALSQGGAADVLKYSMIKVHRLLSGTGAQILMPIHDEIIVEVPKDKIYLAPKIKEAMEDTSFLFDVPMQVGIDFTKTTWKDSKSWKNEGL